MSEDKDNLEPAARMIEAAFGTDPLENHPIAFVLEPGFKEVIKGITQVYTDFNCGPQEVLASLVEILCRISGYQTDDPRNAVLVARAAPIIRQLAAEQRQGTEILMIIAAMLLNMAMSMNSSVDE